MNRRALTLRDFLLLCALAVLCSSHFSRAEPRKLAPEWSVNIEVWSDSSPGLASDGTIYFGTFNGKLWALTSEGKRKWVFRAGREIRSSPAVGFDGTIYFGCRDWNLYAVTPSGKKLWHFATGGWVDSSPALGTNGDIYFGSWDKKFYALSRSGTKKWDFQTGGVIGSSPAIGADGTIYFGSHDRKFYALAPDATKKWEFTTAGAVISSPALNGNECVYFTSVDGFFYAVNLDGTLRWKLKTGGITESSPVIAQDGTICVGVNSECWAITPDGKKRWNRGFERVEAAPLAFRDGTVAFLSRGGNLFDLDMQIELKWYYYGYAFGYASPAIATNGTLFMMESSPHFSALATGTPMANSPWPKFRGNSRNTGNSSDTPGH